MSETLDALKVFGCDVTGALDRFMNDEELYILCLQKVTQDASYQGLKEMLYAGDKERAFDYAHTLKGVLSNLGLTPLYEIITEIVERLRHNRGDLSELVPLYEKLQEKNRQLELLLNQHT